MGTLEDVAHQLTARSIPHAIEGVTLIVRPRDEHGFTARLECREGGAVVSFEGWHERFDDERAAVRCFVFGLTARCRLRVTRRGGWACAWALESVEEGVWQEDSETGLLLVPWWAKKSFEYLQNDWMVME